jgi:hypothetical protein
MKTLCAFALAVTWLSFPIGIFAQKEDGKKIGGIRFGYHTAAMYDNGSKLSGTKNHQSFYLGFFRDNKLIPALHLGTGLEYFQNGYRVDDDNRLVLHYVSIPLDLKVKLGPLFARTGFAPSFKVSEKAMVNGTNSAPNEKSKGFDAPFLLGAGFKILFITVEARYHWGLIELRDGVKSQYLQIGAAISF